MIKGDFTPINCSYIYDYLTDTWSKTEEDIPDEKIPLDKISLFFYTQGYVCGMKTRDRCSVMWCKSHHKYERFQKEGITSEGCKPDSLQCYIDDFDPCNRTVLGKLVPVIWRIRQTEDVGSVEVIVQNVKVKMINKVSENEYGRVYEPIVEEGKICSYTFMLKTKECLTVPASGSRAWSPGVYIPRVIVEQTWLCLQKNISCITGRNVLLPEELVLNSWSELWNVIDYHEDVHISYLRRFIGIPFEHLFFKEGKDNYNTLCLFLGIRPPKSIRKYYLQNPYAIVLYFWMLKVGFRDINAIRIFMKQEYFKCMYSVRYNYNDKKLHGCSLPCANSGKDFVFYVRWMLLRGKQEMTLIRQLDKLMQQGWNRVYDDMLHMFHEYYLVLPEETKELVKRRGITINNHNLLAHDTAGANIVIRKLHYNKEVYALNTEVSDVKFRVIDNMVELPVIGGAMYNCVPTYVDSVLRGNVIIVVGMINNEYKICIELRPEQRNEQGEPIVFGAYQALGKYNWLLDKPEEEAYRTWMEEHKIRNYINEYF